MFGWKEIGTLLRIPRNPWLNYKLYARSLYLIGLGVGAPRIVPLSWSLFLLLVLHFKFFLVVCLFVAFPCVHHHEHLVFAFFYFTVCLIILLLPIKKKKNEGLLNSVPTFVCILVVGGDATLCSVWKS